MGQKKMETKMELKMETKRRWKRRWRRRWKNMEKAIVGEIKKDGGFMIMQSDAVLNLSNGESTHQKRQMN